MNKFPFTLSDVSLSPLARQYMRSYHTFCDAVNFLGMSVEQVSTRSGVPLDLIRLFLSGVSFPSVHQLVSLECAIFELSEYVPESN